MFLSNFKYIIIQEKHADNKRYICINLSHIDVIWQIILWTNIVNRIYDIVFTVSNSSLFAK